MADPVQNVVVDPEFGKLSPSDQQGVLSHFDPGFASLSLQELPAVVTSLQQRARMARPDLQAPPPMPKAPIPGELTEPTTPTAPAAAGPAHQFFQPIANLAGRSGAALARQAGVESELPWYTAGPVSAGLEKGAAETLTGLGHAMGGTEGATPEQLEAHGIWENAGKLAENILEFMSPEEGFKAMSMAGQLSEVARVGKLLEKYPLIAEALQHPTVTRIAGYAPAAARQGAIAGAQTYMKSGGDVTAATQAALTQGALGMTVPGITEDVAGELAGRATRIAPRSATVAGEQVELPPETQLTPKQTQAKNIVTTTGRELVRPHLEALNKSIAPNEPLALPRKTGPYQFELQGVPPVETTTGEAVVPAAEMPRRNITGLPTEPVPGSQSARNIRELGSTAQATPARLMRDQPYMTSAAAGVETEAVTPPRGGGVLRTENADIARAHIDRLNGIIESPGFDRLPAERQQQIFDARDAAQRQMAEYTQQQQTFQRQYGEPNFERIDVPARLQSFDSMTKGLDDLHAEAVNRYETVADRAQLSGKSRDTYSQLRNEHKADWEAYKAAAGTEQGAAAAAKLDQSKQAMEDFLVQHGMKPEEIGAANQAYGAAKDLRPVAKAIDRFADAGYKGTSLATDLAKIARDKPQVKRLLGEEHWNALEVASKVKDKPTIIGNIVDALKKHPLYTGGVLGISSPHIVEQAIAHPYLTGTALTIWAGKAVMNSPKALNYLNYAVENGVKPQIYGPIISNIIVSERQEQQAAQGQTQ